MRYTTIGSDPASTRTVSALALGAMRFGTTTDDATSYEILDRFVEAGGTHAAICSLDANAEAAHGRAGTVVHL